MVRKRLSARQREELREAFWSAEDTTRTQVPDTYEGRLAYERESISSQILNAVHEYMAEHEITQHALATQLGVSDPSWLNLAVGRAGNPPIPWRLRLGGS